MYLFIHTVLFSYSDKYKTKMSCRSHGKANFQMSFLENSLYKSWLKPEKLPSQAICTLCNNALMSVAKMGVSALSFLFSTKQQQVETKRKYFINQFQYYNRQLDHLVSFKSWNQMGFEGSYMKFFSLITFKFKCIV